MEYILICDSKKFRINNMMIKGFFLTCYIIFVINKAKKTTVIAYFIINVRVLLHKGFL